MDFSGTLVYGARVASSNFAGSAAFNFIGSADARTASSRNRQIMVMNPLVNEWVNFAHSVRLRSFRQQVALCPPGRQLPVTTGPVTNCEGTAGTLSGDETVLRSTSLRSWRAWGKDSKGRFD